MCDLRAEQRMLSRPPTLSVSLMSIVCPEAYDACGTYTDPESKNTCTFRRILCIFKTNH
jgi:hypothetical protein